MRITPTTIPDVLLIVPPRFEDARGWFSETYNETRFEAAGIGMRFVQDNQALSRAVGTVRGLHFQAPPRAQAKLVRVIRGRVFDVAVDIRAGSPTYGRHTAYVLSAEGGEQLFIPRGFAHGYCTLEPDTEIAYKVDDVYAPECDAGILWDDPDLGIAWPITAGEVVLSGKDRALPRLGMFRTPFAYEVER